MVRDEWITKRGTEAQPCDPPATPAAGLLTRPAFGADIPGVLQRTPLANTARLALLLLDSEILAEPEWRRSRKDLADRCQKALTRWINERTDGLRHIRPAFSLSVGSRDYYSNFAHATGADQSAALEIAWYVEYADVFVVGPQVKRLESVKKGLGLAALRALSEHGWRSFPMMLPQHQLDLAQFCVWGGNDDIDEYLADVGVEGEEAEELREESISRADIVAATPESILKPYRWKTPKPGSLRWIERRANDPLAREVAEVLRLLSAMPELNNPHEEFQDEGGDFYGFSAFLRWSEDDFTLDLAERLTEYAVNGGVGYEVCGLHRQSLDDLDSFREWMRHIDTLFAVTRLLDRLICLLSGASSTHAVNTDERNKSNESNTVQG